MTLPVHAYKDMYALVDCNNFFVSCERIFNPGLRKRPVVVLSNNDGCIIARSQEAKRLGLPMGAPVFKWQELIDKHNVTLCSANFSLYQDISERVFQVLKEFCEHIEIYSVDEAFLRLNITDKDRLCREIKNSVYKWVGVPVSIGIGTTKTRAKLANRIAKEFFEQKGVYLLSTMNIKLLRQIALEDIWGIGYRSIPALKVFNIYTIPDFLATDRQLLKQEFGVIMERTWLELKGIRCYWLNPARKPKKGILCSRTFKYAHNDYQRISEAVAGYTATAAAGLRRQMSLAGLIVVFITTGKYQQSRPVKSYEEIHLPVPTSHTPTLTKSALSSLAKIYKPGIKYKRAGVFLGHLYEEDEIQQDMFQAAYQTAPKDKKTMFTVDFLNSRWGRGTVKFANQGINSRQITEQSRKSPRYTTNWLELPKVYTSLN